MHDRIILVFTKAEFFTRTATTDVLPQLRRDRPVSLRTAPRTMNQKTATDPMQTLSGSAAPAELIAFSARLGCDETLVQGGGGNTSLKSGNDFWVKASGTWLAQAETRDVFVRLPLARVRTLMAGADAEPALAALAGPDGLRPSIETSLHALLPHAVVAHVHSVNAIAWAVRPDAEQALARALEGLSWAWVPYRRPGLPLTDAIRAAVLEDEGYDVDVIEFIDFAHSPKNLMLRCHRTTRRGTKKLAESRRLQDQYGFEQTLLSLVQKDET